MGRLVVFTGAGISADSGIETFRSSDGTWAKHDVNVVADIRTWKRHFKTVHHFYNDRRSELSRAVPNRCHETLANWQKEFDAQIITQNIDDLLERAGCRDVMHVHGSLTSMRCTACGRTWSVGYDRWEIGHPCDCGRVNDVKPDVVFFGESAPFYQDMYETLVSLDSGDLLVVLGTSGVVVDIGRMAAMTRAETILSNLDSGIGTKSMISGVKNHQFDFVSHGHAVDVVPSIIDERVRTWAQASREFKR